MACTASFPGANGLDNAGGAVHQVDKTGKENVTLPRPDAGVPNNLPVADGTPGRAERLKDEEGFLQALTTNALPAVSFVKPIGSLNEHPGNTLLVDHTQYDTTSILKLIETRWGLSPLGARDAAANNMLNAFDF